MIKRQISPSIKIMIGIVMLMYFRSQLAFANEDIPLCHKQLEELKDDVKNWSERCMVTKTQELGTAECKHEKKYNQARMRKHTSQCFYDGNCTLLNLVYLLRTTPRVLIFLLIHTNVFIKSK